MHLAAKVDVVGPWRDYARTNVDGHPAPARRRLRAAGVARFVHVSSPSVAHAGDALVGAGAGPADPGARPRPLRPQQGVGRAGGAGRDDAPPRTRLARTNANSRAQLTGPDAQLAVRNANSPTGRATRRASGGRRRAPAPGVGARRHPARRPDRRPRPGRAARRRRHRCRADRHHLRRRRRRRARRRPRPGARPARAGAGRLRRRAAARRRAAGVDLRRRRRAGAPESPCRARLARVAGAVAETAPGGASRR